MNEIYPLWVAAHGIMIVTPVNWYQPSSSLKLMMDRLVCADGGNPDPTRTHGKDAQKAKEIELVRDIVLPNITIFGPLVYAIEVAIAVSLILGLATRLGAVLGALMAINLWLGLYNAPGEWPWTYMFLVIIQLIYLIDPPGRSLGVDALVSRRGGTLPKESTLLTLPS
jgi:uncharacterized membrane protein YphA (DoxX/SURF4 family)